MARDSESASQPNRSRDFGILLGAIAAVGYSLSNLALRQLSDNGTTAGSGWDVWVTSTKAVVTGVVAWIIMFRRQLQGIPALPTTGQLGRLFTAGILIQFGGNLCFQIALGYLGLAITVPIVFACIICTGAIAGRSLLGDLVTRSVLIAMLIMTLAIVLLSAGTISEDSAANTTSATVETFTGIAVAIISGSSYGVVGVLMRYFVRDTLSVETMLVVFSLVGIALLSAVAIQLSGWQTLLDHTRQTWPMLTAASITNAVAFFAAAYALRTIDANRLNVINASQNAMCAIGAVILFQERLSPLALCGIALTIAGLLALGMRKADAARHNEVA